MRLSDDMDTTFSDPGSPGPRRRWGRKRTLAAALAVTAAGAAGLVQATTASAATAGTARIPVTVANADNWGVGWPQAWANCRNWYPNTKSVEFDHSTLYPKGSAKPTSAVQDWNCRDTP